MSKRMRLALEIVFGILGVALVVYNYHINNAYMCMVGIEVTLAALVSRIERCEPRCQIVENKESEEE